ncbi:hypothetical protein Trydic_g16051 [Trypoxylus dichotomus]
MLSSKLGKTSLSLMTRNLLSASTAKMSSGHFETLQVSIPKPFVYHVELHRPKKRNAINEQMWKDIDNCFKGLNDNQECRVIILSGAGKIFSGGIDLTSMMNLAPKMAELNDLARKARLLHPIITLYQQAISSLEKCCKPVLTAVHSACIGAGVDTITAADIRYCTKDAYFQVKETLIGMAADVGTLQRLPKIIGSQSLVRELCFTGRELPADEALNCGLVSKVFDDKESMIAGALKVAEQIAAQSPVAIQTTKLSLIYSRDHTVQEGLDHIAQLNQFLLQSEDFTNAVVGQMTNEKVAFAKL